MILPTYFNDISITDHISNVQLYYVIVYSDTKKVMIVMVPRKPFLIVYANSSLNHKILLTVKRQHKI